MIKPHNLGDSLVDFIVRPWCKTADYWDVYWDVTRTVKLRFDEEGISIPFPPRNVQMFREPTEARPEREVVLQPAKATSKQKGADNKVAANVGELDDGDD